LLEGERRDAILQARERFDVSRRQQVAACRHQLPELDEGRSQALEIGGELFSFSLRCGGRVEHVPMLDKERRN
jgi:hypothetical protein